MEQIKLLNTESAPGAVPRCRLKLHPLRINGGKIPPETTVKMFCIILLGRERDRRNHVEWDGLLNFSSNCSWKEVWNVRYVTTSYVAQHWKHHGQSKKDSFVIFIPRDAGQIVNQSVFIHRLHACRLNESFGSSAIHSHAFSKERKTWTL